MFIKNFHVLYSVKAYHYEVHSLQLCKNVFCFLPVTNSVSCVVVFVVALNWNLCSPRFSRLKIVSSLFLIALREHWTQVGRINAIQLWFFKRLPNAVWFWESRTQYDVSMWRASRRFTKDSRARARTLQACFRFHLPLWVFVRAAFILVTRPYNLSDLNTAVFFFS